MGDFKLARVCRRRSEIDIRARVSSLYGGAEVGDLKVAEQPYVSVSELCRTQLVAVRLLSLAPLCLPGMEPYSISDQSAAGE